MFNKKFYLFSIIWIMSLLAVSLWTFENPDKIELIKNIYKKNNSSHCQRYRKNQEINIVSNSFIVTFKKIISLSHKDSFYFI